MKTHTITKTAEIAGISSCSAVTAARNVRQSVDLQLDRPLYAADKWLKSGSIGGVMPNRVRATLTIEFIEEEEES